MFKEFTIRVFQDGNKVCALFGLDLQEGIAGFGTTIREALESFAINLIRENCGLCGYKTNTKIVKDTITMQNYIEYRCSNPDCDYIYLAEQ